MFLRALRARSSAVGRMRFDLGFGCLRGSIMVSPLGSGSLPVKSETAVAPGGWLQPLSVLRPRLAVSMRRHKAY
jgi:hypothetical protein